MARYRTLALVGIMLPASLLLAASAAAQTRIDIFGPGANRVPIAVAPLASVGGDDAALEREFARVLDHDLLLSGMYRVIDRSAYIEGVPAGPFAPEKINFLNWQTIGARGLVLGRYERSGSGLTVEIAYFNVPSQSMIGGRRFRGSAGDIARMAHRTADAILEFSTGIPGPFDSRIAYISNRNQRMKDVHVFSFDGRIEKITDHRSITMAPSWSPDLSSIVFTSFRGGNPSLWSVRLGSKAETQIAAKMGLNIGGLWHPREDVLAVAREEGGNTDIFALEMGTQRQVRLTEHWGIDVDPSWSPDGRRLAFCSSRGGTPQVYTMGYPDKAVQRVTFQGSYNCAPVWSPDGRSIAYAGRVGRDFHIFVVPAAGGTPKQVTFVGSNEDPTWSPDSRFLAFSRETKKGKKLWLADVTGHWEHELTTGNGDDSSPSWSRRLD